MAILALGLATQNTLLSLAQYGSIAEKFAWNAGR